MNNSYSHWEDLDLWNEVKVHSNKEAFTQLHHRFSTPLFRLAYRKTADAAVSEDLVQDLFVTLWIQRDRITIKKDVNIYLFGALKNRIITQLRKAIGSNESSISEIDPDLLAGYSTNTVEESILVNEVQKQYEYQLQQIPEKSRIVFELSRSGLTNKEIAELLGIVEKTVEFHISKCLKILKNNLIYLVLMISCM
jgi:RNA polymerase sigma-70 factor (family 1)